MERHGVTEPKNKISFLAVLNSKRLAASSWKHHLGYDKYTDKNSAKKKRKEGYIFTLSAYKLMLKPVGSVRRPLSRGEDTELSCAQNFFKNNWNN